MFYCNICPRKCNAQRRILDGDGFCGCGEKMTISKYGLHFWEEPCISGSRGSGTIFFSGCAMDCVYCQNRDISKAVCGKSISEDKLVSIMDELKALGAHNINFVTPTHYAKNISSVLSRSKPALPVVYNCGGYELIDTLKTLSGKVDIYLPDFKYSSNALALKYSGISDYFDVVLPALFEMYYQVGDAHFDDDDIMTRGLIIRHLILPGHLRNTFDFLDIFCEHFRDKGVYLSLMAQYTPSVSLPAPLNRRVSAREYATAVRYARECGITHAFIQDLSSAESAYIPEFDKSEIGE